ncbi:hypothetical protein PIROE2DRAFT_9013, partial [Piromyces sp. E2]
SSSSSSSSSSSNNNNNNSRDNFNINENKNISCSINNNSNSYSDYYSKNSSNTSDINDNDSDSNENYNTDYNNSNEEIVNINDLTLYNSHINKTVIDNLNKKLDTDSISNTKDKESEELTIYENYADKITSYINNDINLSNDAIQNDPTSSKIVNKKNILNCNEDIQTTSEYQNNELKIGKSRIEKLDDIKKTLDEIKIDIKGKSKIEENEHVNNSINYFNSYHSICNNKNTMTIIEEENESNNTDQIISRKDHIYSSTFPSSVYKAIGNKYEKDVNKIIEDFGYNSFNNIFDSNNDEESFIDQSKILDQDNYVQSNTSTDSKQLNNISINYNTINNDINNVYNTSINNRNMIDNNNNSNIKNKNSHFISDINLNYNLSFNEVYNSNNSTEDYRSKSYNNNNNNNNIPNQNKGKRYFNDYEKKNSNNFIDEQYHPIDSYNKEVFSHNNIKKDQSIISNIKTFVKNTDNDELNNSSFTSINEFFNRCDNETLKNNYLASPFKSENDENMLNRDYGINNNKKSLSYENITFTSPNILFNKNDTNIKGMFNNYYITNNISSSNNNDSCNLNNNNCYNANHRSNFLNIFEKTSNNNTNNNNANSIPQNDSISENPNPSKKNIIKELLNKINTDIRNKSNF